MTKKISHADQRNAPPEEELPILGEEDAAPEATPEQIAEVIRLSREQFSLDKEIDKIEEELSKKKKALINNVENELPKAMEAAHMEVCPLNGGYETKLKTVIRASIPSLKSKVPDAVERNAIGIAYMDEIAPDMVDTIVTIRYPKGTEKELKDLLARNKRRKNPLELELSRTVNTGSLQAWIAKRDAAGLATDDTKINIQRVKVAEVKAPKGKKDAIEI